MSEITIVMYHYVRKIKNSNWPKIKGLEFDAFRRQLDFLAHNFNFITAEDVIFASKQKKTLPKNACWLTFDDGYKDHISFVLPELVKRKIQGSFFPPVKPIVERSMLDVNSIHYILASTNDVANLIRDLNTEIRNHGYRHDDLMNLWNDHAISDSYDTREIVYIKALLQHGLPELIRNNITSKLFEKYVGISQIDFADQLYMSELDIKNLVCSGMYVGSHGYRHLWLNKEDRDSQKYEIDKSISFLTKVGARTKDWIMCYPYGAYNKETLELLTLAGCAIGLTTRIGKANIDENRPLEMPRIDTINFPR